MKVKKAYDIKRNGVSILLPAGELPLSDDIIVAEYSVLISDTGKELWKDDICYGESIILEDGDKQENYEERDIPPEPEPEPEEEQ